MDGVGTQTECQRHDWRSQEARRASIEKSAPRLLVSYIWKASSIPVSFFIPCSSADCPYDAPVCSEHGYCQCASYQVWQKHHSLTLIELDIVRVIRSHDVIHGQVGGPACGPGVGGAQQHQTGASSAQVRQFNWHNVCMPTIIVAFFLYQIFHHLICPGRSRWIQSRRSTGQFKTGQRQKF